MAPTSRFGAEIKKWRGRLRLSQAELAGRTGLDPVYLSEIERGERSLSLESFNKLALALEISPAIFFPRQKSAASRQPGQLSLSDQLVDILLIEDNPCDAELTKLALTKNGIANQIHIARDGAEALDFLFCQGKYARRSAAGRPHLILLDLCLPKIDGLEVLRRVKADPRTHSIPVVVLAGSREDCDIAAGKKLGAEAYLVKPIGFGNLNELAPRLNLKWALVQSSASPTDYSPLSRR